MIAALICVTRALVGLHALKFVQRDVRWPNILCLGDDAYILIDFESAGRDGDPIPDEMLDSKVLDPLVISDVRHIYRSCHDMYQLGKLIGDINNPSLQQLRMNLQSANDAERCTAETALSILIALQNGRAHPSLFAPVSE
uniref:AlNc14C9G1202 protein n=1 Tax=Albugo laibachii Nc14 TaxID=890382 RepID=F0W2F1_9STRA|nr:AlNc14C9G1202 [Albugo laibachii Nc14]|eukprot:CCA15237.1 AlNc14C9G1202 [Albugo laibachii Nc14]